MNTATRAWPEASPAMPNVNDEEIMRLERAWPGWQVWVVRRVVGGPLWCARRHGEPVASLHAATRTNSPSTSKRQPADKPQCGPCITGHIGQRLLDVPRPGSDASRSPGRGTFHAHRPGTLTLTAARVMD